MKLLLLLTFFAGLNASAQEDSFTMTKGGRDYLCQATDSGPIGDPVDCVNKAYAGPFSRDQARELCNGAANSGPAECGIKAYAGPFSKEQAIRLCARTGSIRRAECAIKAYAGPYNKEESIQICQNANLNLLMRSLNLINSSPEALKKSQQFKLKMSLK